MSKRIEDVCLAVEAMHDCKAKHECSVPVTEMFGNGKTWEGVVEMFALTGHPKAKRCYAWNFREAEPRYIAVLELPPVTPRTLLSAPPSTADSRNKGRSWRADG